MATTTTGSTLDVDVIRSKFPALAGRQVYMDNAGGSQVLSSVIESVSNYMATNTVQLGATYATSRVSTQLVEDATQIAANYINASSKEEVVFGSSTTQLFRNLATALKVEAGDEFVLSMIDHEANLAAWVQVAEWKGVNVKWWKPTKNTTSNPVLEVDDLKRLLTKKTRLVCCTHTSNILGGVTDIKAIASAIKETNPATLLAVDAVAYAPHGPIDVQDLGVDFYAFSWYKVYGPHVAMLYASKAAQKQLQSLGHYFKPADNLENMLGLAGGSYEAVQSIPNVVLYLNGVGWQSIIQHEEEIQEILLAYLRSKPELIKIYGEPSSDRRLRVPVISFRIRGLKSVHVVDEIECRSDMGCRSGHFYSVRLCDNVLGLKDVDDGVIRCSLLHYNTKQEVQKYVSLLDEIIKENMEVRGGEPATAGNDW